MMHKILFLLLSTGIINYEMHAADNPEQFRIAAEVLNAKALEKHNLLPCDTKNGDHVYITAPRDVHEILIKYNWVTIRYFYHPDGRQERIWNNKIESWK